MVPGVISSLPSLQLRYSLLQATLGGLARDFNVLPLSDLLFRFSIFYKQVGVFIYHLQYFRCENFVVFFHLWNGGGPNWQKELSDFELEEASSWHTVVNRKMSYADAMKKPVLSGANDVPIWSHRKFGNLAFLLFLVQRVMLKSLTCF
jgi:hypothetical protein